MASTQPAGEPAPLALPQRLALPPSAPPAAPVTLPDRTGPHGAPVSWNPAWPKFHTGEWIATGAGALALLASRILPQREVHWRGGILFDEKAREHLRVGGLSGRRWARDASDIGLVVNESWPYFDSFVVAAWYRDSPEVAWQQGLITAEVLAVTAGMQSVVASLVARERPYGRLCGSELLPDESRDCDSRDRYFSFYSGHTSQAFAGAAVNCMHHAYVPLYGGGWNDTWPCVGSFAIAAATAFFRVGTDVHYTTDVATGAIMGTATGLLLPWFLHYRHGTPTPLGDDRSWRFTLIPTGLGASGVLVF
ncbi:MAG TPA: phosphatase PAP2 family protein [Polyangiaceae bacterium]|nr:phosphatase PAP2 family protein [Polyangiaceae bacterium]